MSSKRLTEEERRAIEARVDGILARKTIAEAYAQLAADMTADILVLLTYSGALEAHVAVLETALRALVDADGLPPGWVTRSVNTEPLTCCGYCGSLVAYFPSQRLWECDHYDDCPVSVAQALLQPAHKAGSE